jgi:hypothetical protein
MHKEIVERYMYAGAISRDRGPSPRCSPKTGCTRLRWSRMVTRAGWNQLCAAVSQAKLPGHRSDHFTVVTHRNCQMNGNRLIFGSLVVCAPAGAVP